MMCPTNDGAGKGKRQSGVRPFVSLIFEVYTMNHPLVGEHASIVSFPSF